MAKSNQKEVDRMMRAVRAYLKDGVIAAVRMTRRNLVKATPKRTQFAAGWALGIGGLPDIVPKDKPELPLYALPGDNETDAEMEAGYDLGDDTYLLSPGTYIVYLNAGTSPQADENFIQDAVTEAIKEHADWKWEGLAA